ncbi:hypothetical protein ABPG73_022090 [Tetrahymena malaccensis]
MGQVSSSLDKLSLSNSVLIPLLCAQGYIGYKFLQQYLNSKQDNEELAQLTQKLSQKTQKQSKESEFDEIAKLAQNSQNIPIISERKSPDEQEAEVFKICVTGGPCGGKTSGLVYVQEKMKELGYLVFVVPEAATTIANGGGMLDMQNYNMVQAIQFQTNLLKLQIRLENTMTQIAKLSKKKAIVLCDRGLMDGQAYVEPKEWAELLSINNLNEVLMRDDRYDLVIHLVTAALGAEKFYNQQNSARFETAEEAAIMDKKTQDAWLGHPNHVIVDNNVKSFEEKLTKMLNAVKQCVGIESSTTKYTRKFLLKPNENISPNIPKDLKCQRFFIEDVFLESGEEQGNKKSFRKLRRRGQNQNYAYILSASKVDKISKDTQSSEIQYKKLLSYREYTFMLSKSDTKRNNLITYRDVFLYQGNVFILDTYLNVKEGFNILKVILKNKNQNVEIPPFLEVVKEITDDLGYKRSTISKKDWYFSKGDASLLKKNFA